MNVLIPFATKDKLRLCCISDFEFMFLLEHRWPWLLVRGLY
uniref:Protein SMG7 isoform X1 n=1 Tax=Rhizophora mucronata TaxID=61149 RepID=A0A2P2JSX1_RHIMU